MPAMTRQLNITVPVSVLIETASFVCYETHKGQCPVWGTVSLCS